MRCLSECLREAAADYRLLLDKGYPEKATVKLVGDRRRLDAEERLILFRAVHPTALSEERRAKLLSPAPGSFLLVDLYNVAFTLVHRIIGKPCFISTDGLLRDAGANYGRVPHEEELRRAFNLVALSLVAVRPATVEAYIDAPVSRSESHAAAFREAFEAALREAATGRSPVSISASPESAAHESAAHESADPAISWSVEVVPSADAAISAALSAARARGGDQPFAITSDSVLVDRAMRVYDLALLISRSAFPEASPIPEFGLV